MLHGRIGDTSGSPYIEGRLLFPDLRLESDISFLVDTGADASLLMPSDAANMNLDYDALLPAEQPPIGIGGTIEAYTHPAVLLFGSRYWYFLDLEIAAPYDHLDEMPSLLGRDVLRHWDMHYQPVDGQLTFEVRHSDQVTLGQS